MSVSSRNVLRFVAGQHETEKDIVGKETTHSDAIERSTAAWNHTGRRRATRTAGLGPPPMGMYRASRRPNPEGVANTIDELGECNTRPGDTSWTVFITAIVHT